MTVKSDVRFWLDITGIPGMVKAARVRVTTMRDNVRDLFQCIRSWPEDTGRFSCTGIPSVCPVCPFTIVDEPPDSA